ncbi:sterile alpha motif domain-containing protein 1-like [Hippopotamus amphibius kiboko]|uniref:sterile alpha motif domain-containing protein 1-like n=1 Tax=Hippopotamus amphibius kiboko TaxID=575201 RepID=UPI002598A48F|nr:sterile alpha motif domain-containing protein 1-like [Hippopotamus amphibius kiboko]
MTFYSLFKPPTRPNKDPWLSGRCRLRSKAGKPPTATRDFQELEKNNPGRREICCVWTALPGRGQARSREPADRRLRGPTGRQLRRGQAQTAPHGPRRKEGSPPRPRPPAPRRTRYPEGPEPPPAPASTASAPSTSPPGPGRAHPGSTSCLIVLRRRRCSTAAAAPASDPAWAAVLPPAPGAPAAPPRRRTLPAPAAAAANQRAAGAEQAARQARPIQPLPARRGAASEMGERLVSLATSEDRPCLCQKEKLRLREPRISRLAN